MYLEQQASQAAVHLATVSTIDQDGHLAPSSSPTGAPTEAMLKHQEALQRFVCTYGWPSK